MKLHNISFGNIKRRKGKMLFLVLGLVIGISTVVTLLSFTESMTRDIEQRLNQFGANIIMVPKSDNLSLTYGGIHVGGVNYSVREFEQEKLANIHTIKNNKNLCSVVDGFTFAGAPTRPVGPTHQDFGKTDSGI